MANGHHLKEIWTYSLPAIQVYVDLIYARQRQHLHDLTVAVRHSQGMDAKVLQQFLSSLEGET